MQFNAWNVQASLGAELNIFAGNNHESPLPPPPLF